MVESQYQLLKEKFEIEHVVAVVGPSMGGMQVLQWGVSHPEMDGRSPLQWCHSPRRRRGPWRCFESDASAPSCWIRLGTAGTTPRSRRRASGLWRDILNLLAARTPDMYQAQLTKNGTGYPAVDDSSRKRGVMKIFDANDWIYQTWAYEKHDVGTTPGFNGDTEKALGFDQGEDAHSHRHQGSAQS